MFPGVPYHLMEKSLSAGGEKYDEGLTVKKCCLPCIPVLVIHGKSSLSKVLIGALIFSLLFHSSCEKENKNA